MKTFRIDLTDRQKRYLLFFIFDFDAFLTAFVKNLMKRPPVFMIDIKSSYKLLLSHKNLRSRNFYSETTTLQIFLKNCWETRFHCLFSLNEKIIAMCHLMIHIKFVAIICFNENWSSLKGSFWNNGPSNVLSHFFEVFYF